MLNDSHMKGGIRSQEWQEHRGEIHGEREEQRSDHTG